MLMTRNRKGKDLAFKHLTLAYGPDETSEVEKNSHDRLRLLESHGCTGIGITKLGLQQHRGIAKYL